jgi:hypothetical protein
MIDRYVRDWLFADVTKGPSARPFIGDDPERDPTISSIFNLARTLNRPEFAEPTWPATYVLSPYRVAYLLPGAGPWDVRWDDAVTGLGLRVYPSGKKAFVLSYRAGGRKRLMALGPFGVRTVEQARDLARIRACLYQR